MRRGNKPYFLFDDNKTLVGVNLGADHCAEHEFGIRNIYEEFGVPTGDLSVYGLARRTIRQLPVGGYTTLMEVTPKRGQYGFGCANRYVLQDTKTSVFDRELWFYPKDSTLSGAWSDQDFGVLARKDDRKLLKNLWEAFQELDVAMFLAGTNNPFENGGLCLCIASKIPSEHVETWEKYDRERHQLHQDMEASGIKKKLEKAGLNYFSLTPERGEDGSLMFWLNPFDQDKYEAGNYSLEDIEDWIKGKGRVVRAVPRRRDRW